MLVRKDRKQIDPWVYVPLGELAEMIALDAMSSRERHVFRSLGAHLRPCLMCLMSCRIGRPEMTTKRAGRMRSAKPSEKDIDARSRIRPRAAGQDMLAAAWHGSFPIVRVTPYEICMGIRDGGSDFLL